ncbi:hypothetical protein BLOT_015693 [Blomia tropicalis]|nr:hypothetical protein BLOT_015693 [Blomia tropicalis]
MERSNVWGDGLNTNNENTNCAQEQEISKFFNFEDTSYKAAICRLVSIDNIPLSLLAKSNDLKKLLKYRFNESHQSPNSIRKILFEYKFKVGIFVHLHLSNLTEESSKLEFKRLNIHSDVVTRWDSLFTMLKDFDKMHNCIECALMKIYSNERSSKKRSSIEILTFEEPELCRIKELIQILDPIHNAIAELSKKDTNLFVAELSIELMLDILLMIKQSSSSLKIYNELKDQLEKRRTILSDIAIVLYDPKSAIYKYGHFERPAREKLIKAMIKIIKLQDQNDENIDQQLDDSEYDELFQDPPTHSNKKRKFEEIIRDSFNQSQQILKCHPKINDIRNSVDKDLNLFIETLTMSPTLNKIKKFVNIIKPTSIICEQTFSITNRLLTKFRTRMNNITNNIFHNVIRNSREFT